MIEETAGLDKMESQMTQGQLELERIFSKYYAKMEEPEGLDGIEDQITQSQLEIERIFNKFYATLERIAKGLDINYPQLVGEGPNNSSESHYEKLTEIIDKRDQESQNIPEELGQQVNS